VRAGVKGRCSNGGGSGGSGVGEVGWDRRKWAHASLLTC
jgi:hypothetical protein